MECVLKFKFSIKIDYFIMIIPLILCVLVSFFTFIKCYFFFKKFPDRLTQPVFQEIKYYPIVFLLCNSTSIILANLSFYEVQVPEIFFIIDQFFKGIQGSLIAFVFFWIRLGVTWTSLSQILLGNLQITFPSKNDLNEMERVF